MLSLKCLLLRLVEERARFPRGKWSKERTNGIEMYFRKDDWVGEGGVGDLLHCASVLCHAGMLDSLLTINTHHGSTPKSRIIKLSLH